MYVKTRTGKWATHRPMPDNKTKTGTQLYTLEQAISMGYVPPSDLVAKPNVVSGQKIDVYIDEKPVTNGDKVVIGWFLEQQTGLKTDVGFDQSPSKSLKTYKDKDTNSYKAVRLTLNAKNKWVKVTYENGNGIESLPLLKSNRDEGYFLSTEISEHIKSIRDKIFYCEDGTGDEIAQFQYEFEELLKPYGEYEKHLSNGKVKKIYNHPPDQEWMKEWLERGIRTTQKKPELYAFYKVWKSKIENKTYQDSTVPFELLKIWAIQDSHLVKIEEAHRKKYINRRNDQYKKLAYRIVQKAKDGGEIILSHPPKKLQKVKADKAVLQTEESATASRKKISEAASSTFIGYLHSCAKREGVKITEVCRAANTSHAKVLVPTTNNASGGVPSIP
jgi:hypothetical protein